MLTKNRYSNQCYRLYAPTNLYFHELMIKRKIEFKWKKISQVWIDSTVNKHFLTAYLIRCMHAFIKMRRKNACFQTHFPHTDSSQLAWGGKNKLSSTQLHFFISGHGYVCISICEERIENTSILLRLTTTFLRTTRPTTRIVFISFTEIQFTVWVAHIFVHSLVCIRWCFVKSWPSTSKT